MLGLTRRTGWAIGNVARRDHPGLLQQSGLAVFDSKLHGFGPLCRAISRVFDNNVARRFKRSAPNIVYDIVSTQGKEIVSCVNTPEPLERSLRPATVFNSVANLWESKRLPQLKESSKYSVPKLIVKHLRPFFGQMALEEIKTGNVNDWIAEMQRKELEPKTIHNMWKLFRAIMNWHAQQNDEPPRKWYPILPTIPEDEQRWFTQAEFRCLVEAAEDQYKLLFHLAGSSGLRAGELFGFHVEDLDLNRGVIRVRRSVWQGKEVTPKTRKGYRDVWIDSATARMLRDHLGSRTAGRIFQSRRGMPLDTSNVLSEVLYPLCDRLSIPRGGLHAFRHGRVSHLQANNVPSDFTKAQVGHSSLRTTSGYTHFSEDFARQTVERLASELPSWTHSESLDSVVMPAKAV